MYQPFVEITSLLSGECVGLAHPLATPLTRYSPGLPLSSEKYLKHMIMLNVEVTFCV
jgi:hypothetical protein